MFSVLRPEEGEPAQLLPLFMCYSLFFPLLPFPPSSPSLTAAKPGRGVAGANLLLRALP